MSSQETFETTLFVPVRRLFPEIELPVYHHNGCSGMDLHANLQVPVLLKPLERRLFSTGLAIELPLGYEAQVRPRSGLALHHGITVLNTPGTVDASYRGEIGVLLINLGEDTYTINPQTRIAQLVVARVALVEWQPRDVLSCSSRGTGGFGSTGEKAISSSNIPIAMKY